MRPVGSWRRKAAEMAVFAAVVAVCYLLGAGCLIQRVTGFPCPGCGMTRAALALVKGDFAGAMALHGMVWSLPLVGALWLWDGRPFRAGWLNVTLIIVLAAGFLIHWILRLSGYV